MKTLNRRDFLRAGGAATLFAGTPGLAYSHVVGGNSAFDDYRALVCVYLCGGNDSFNVLVPRSNVEYGVYAKSRRNLAIAQAELLAITTPGPGAAAYGLHPSMGAVRSIYEEGDAAFVTNVGALVEPTTKEQFYSGAAAMPSQLFSHHDQQDRRTSLQGGFESASRWVERVATLIRERFGAQGVLPNASSAKGVPRSSDISTTFPRSQLGAQLQNVTRLIAMHDNLKIKRQLFIVAAGGFDTHDDQSEMQPFLLGDVSESISAFHTALGELGMQNNVTTFTQSEFGRALPSNGSGTDHGWGGNQLVVGGAVKGQQLYGSYPSLQIGGPEDVGGGRFIPSTSADQYAATLARWFGIPAEDLAYVAPHIGNFAQQDLGFMIA